MMDRRTFLGTLGLLAAPLGVEAQQAGKVPRIGYLALNLKGPDPRPREAFLQGLRDLGHVEGRTLLIEYRDAEGRTERLPALAAELVALKVDVIVAGAGTRGALAAQEATTTLPIVFPAVGDPVQEGIVSSLARPRGNITGLAVVSPELLVKSVEILKHTVPGARRPALLMMEPDARTESAIRERVKGAEVAAQKLGMKLQVVRVKAEHDFERAFSDMTKARADALTVPVTALFELHRPRLVGLAARHRLPAVYTLRTYVEAGGLMSYGPDFLDLFRRAAGYVDKILKGARPGDLPVEQPTKFELVINLKTAKALGLAIPPSLLQRADQVLE